MPASKNSSASFSVDTVMPRAPASSWAWTTGRLLLVFTCGRSLAPSASMRACMRAMSACIRAVSTRAAGVCSSGIAVMGRGYGLARQAGRSTTCPEASTTSRTRLPA